MRVLKQRSIKSIECKLIFKYQGIHANVRGVNRGVLYNVLGVTPESLQREFDVDDSLVDDGYGPILLDIMRRQWDKKPTFILKKRIEHIAPQLTKS